MSQTPRNIGPGSLIKYRFPLTAISSILHRISGVILFLFIPFMLWLLHKSLASAQDFQTIHAMMACALVRFLVWAMVSALIYHFLAGLRHLMMDMGYFEELNTGRISSLIVMILSIILIIILGVSLW